MILSLEYYWEDYCFNFYAEFGTAVRRIITFGLQF